MFASINWGTVISVIVALVIIMVLYHLLTKRTVSATTGQIKTSFLGFSGFSGFEGDKKDNMDGEEN